MSVLVHGRAIRRAVAGELSEPAERRLRAHLRACEACRARYDELARVAEALAAPAPRLSSAARERERLVAALGSGEGAAGAEDARARLSPTSRARRPVWAVSLLVPAAAALWLVVRPAPTPPSQRPGLPDGGAGQITWRGAPGSSSSAIGEEAAPPAALLVFASRKGGDGSRDDDRGGGARSRAKPSAKAKGMDGVAPTPHVRLVADLPASGEGRVSQGDFVQFVLRGLQVKAFVTVIGIDDEGEVHTYVPPAGAEVTSHEPSSSSISLGASVDLSTGHRTGRLRLYALLPAAPLEPARLRAAARKVDLTRAGAPPLDLPIPQVAGVLTIGP